MFSLKFAILCEIMQCYRNQFESNSRSLQQQHWEKTSKKGEMPGHKAGKSMQFLTICTVKFARSTFNASQHFRNSESINALTRFSLIVFYFIALLVSLLLKMPTVFSNFTYYDHFRQSQLHKGSGYMHKVTTV